MTRNGFTLLEILVVLVVVGLLLVGLSQGVQYGLQAWRTQVRLTESHGDLDAVDGALREMIEAMDPGNGAGPAPIVGRSDRLDFVTELPESAAMRPSRQVEASLLLDGQHRLVLSWRPFLHVQRLRPAPPPTVNVLVAGLSGAQLSFWRPDGGWQSAWTERALPALVRLRLVFPAGDLRHWPDIVAAPLLSRR
jgi:general secretion pathway protein J